MNNNEEEFSREIANELSKELSKKGSTKPCSRCNNTQFSIIGFSYFDSLDLNKPNIRRIGGPNIPVALVACNNCGAITPHALGIFESITKKGVLFSNGQTK